MQQKVLSQIDIYTDTVQGSQIDNSQLKNDLLNSSILEKRLSDNPKDYSFSINDIDILSFIDEDKSSEE